MFQQPPAEFNHNDKGKNEQKNQDKITVRPHKNDDVGINARVYVVLGDGSHVPTVGRSSWYWGLGFRIWFSLVWGGVVVLSPQSGVTTGILVQGSGFGHHVHVSA